ncbi:c-type cytochrome [Lentiprolixibacter aurantiacus]|uniref:Cytochrome c n=1 Tax=Lentiprolixibacter aurantiacus TaxID=2993939 RepID=A0AAE3MMY5_9FLAO|nr:cytochrome c [Lentiprolixibacter aurantiacus]
MKSFLFGYLICVAALALCLQQDKELTESIKRGKAIYSDFCVTCHMEKGEGVPYTFPPLAKSDYLANNREASIRGIKYGQRGEIIVNGEVYNNTMMPLGLEDQEIADVMNFVMNSWGNNQDKPVTVEEVAQTRPR